jgi:membrane protein implicated in regulation of membrane protease activity
MTMISLSTIKTMGWKKTLPIMLLLLAMTPAVFAQESGGTVIYIDPITLIFILALLTIVIAVVIFAFMAIHNATVQNQLVATYQQTSQAQTTIMNNMAQAITTNLNVQTGIMVEEARHRMNMDDRWFNLTAQQQSFMQYMDNRQLNIYEKQVDANIQFMNNVFNLLAMQTAFSDISQLNKDKLRAMAIQSAKPYEIEVITTETPEKKETTAQPK